MIKINICLLRLDMSYFSLKKDAYCNFSAIEKKEIYENYNMIPCYVFNDFGNFTEIINIPKDKIYEFRNEKNFPKYFNQHGNLIILKQI